MSDDEEKIKKIKNNLSEFDLRELNLANFTSEEEARFHQYIKGICQRLLGDTLNLDDQNIIFALSDRDVANAAHVSIGDANVIYITEKLLDLCQNEDQLAFILGHELGHYEEKLRQDEHQNSKAEETACDLRAIQKMARGGYNLEEACNIAVKLFDSDSISIEDLKDPHTNDTSRVNLINAMKKKEKDRIIEEQNVEITESTPIPQEIIQMVHNRPKTPSLYDSLSEQIRQISDEDGDVDEKRIALWLKSFHENIVSDGHSLAMTKDDAKALARCIEEWFRVNGKFPDKFLATVFADMESLRGKDKFAACREIMHNVLDNITSYDAEYCPAKVNADAEDSQTAVWLRYYLHGFREAEGEQYDNIIDNLEYVEKFVARRYNDDYYTGIYVKNFNLLELDFNKNDVGKIISPQIFEYIRSHINGKKDEFVTFSGLTAHKMGASLLLKYEKHNWSIFVDSSGKIAYSFPNDNLAKMQTLLMKEIIENSLSNVEAINQGKIIDIAQRFDILHEAHKIISSVSVKNDLDNILEINEKKEGSTEVLYDDVMAVLSPKAQQFFSERIKDNDENLFYTEKITDLYADVIRTAPKEYFDRILVSLAEAAIYDRLSGEDKLMRAFLDNPVFNEELSKIIKSYEAFPEDAKEGAQDSSDSDETPDSLMRKQLLQLIRTMQEITDFKLKEHLEQGGNFDNFEQPFKKDLAKLFGFAPEGDIDETTALQNLHKTRNVDKADITLYEKAYVVYSSYDALKSDTNINFKLLLGFNAAGTTLVNRCGEVDYCYIDENEKKQLAEKKQRFIDATEKIHQRLVERINKTEKNIPHKNETDTSFSTHDIYDMTLYNDKIIEFLYGKRGFFTLISNNDFEEIILQHIATGDSHKIHTSILSLTNILGYYENTKESDAHKEYLYPTIAKIFENQNLSIVDKVKLFSDMTYFNIFASDYKRYYEVLIGADGKSGLLNEIDNLVDEVDVNYKKFYCYKILMNKFARIPDPEIRADVIKKAAENYWLSHSDENGKEYNDMTASQESRSWLINDVLRLKKESSVAELDKTEFFKELSELTLAQKELSLAMKPDGINLQTSDSKALAAAYGLDVVAYALQHYPETRTKILDFLLGEGKAEDAQELVKSIQISACKEHDEHCSPKILGRYLNGEDISAELKPYERECYDKLNPQSCLHFKKEFDAAPLEAKALIVNEIITSGKTSWEETFRIVSDKLFADVGELGKTGSDFLHSYIKARPNSEKTFYLAAMMAAANNKSKSASNYINSPYTPEERNLAKGLRLFLENSGPAGTKLAQAMASYSDVPDFIRYEMQFAKSEANPPARWDIFSGNDETIDKLSEYGALGKRRGSASFFVTYDLGDKIVKILRRGAKLKADSEFAIYSEMLQTLSSEYNNISSFKRLVQNAAENVHIETDLEIGEKQYEDAKQLYPESVAANGITFKIQVMDWVARDKDWAIMDKAQGVDFKELDEPYKTAAAKAVLSTELSNMLSGKRFDSDRHGGQYKFDTQNNVIGVFDTGSMSMKEPTDKERQALGTVLARTLKSLRHNQNVASVFSVEIDKAANEFYKNEISRNSPVPPYLSEFQRGMLALNDFYTDLSAKDMLECVIKALDNGKNKIHPQIVKAFTLEIKKGLNSHNGLINELLEPENTDKLTPETRAERRIGKILFDAVFQNMSEGKKLNISPDVAQKLFSRLESRVSVLQIVKGVVRGAHEKLNPNNYPQKDREELGMFLYQVCQADIKNQKLQKSEAIENIINETAAKNQQSGAYTKNIMQIISIMANIPSLSDEKLKKAALFIAFADNDVAKGFKKALKQDKKVSFAKKTILKLAPMDFIPRNAKKMLVKAVSKRLVVNFVAKQLSGISSNSPNKNTQRS